MNAAVRLYADAMNAHTKMENGFDLTEYDYRTLAFAKEYARLLLAVDINIQVDQMLDTAWELFSRYFKKEEIGIKQQWIETYWKEQPETKVETDSNINHENFDRTNISFRNKEVEQ